MTNEEILACTEPSRELDAVAAEVVGWIATGYWRPSSDIEQAFALQARIKELGLWHSFISWLWEITTTGAEDDYNQEHDMWSVATASALDRTKAATLAVRKGNKASCK